MGVTVMEFPATVPTPWSILKLLAPITDHCRFVLIPGPTLVGLAANELMTGGFEEGTVATAVAVTDPNEFVAVRV